MNFYFVTGAIILGAVVSDLIRWNDSGDAWKLRPFISSLVRGVVGALSLSVAQVAPINMTPAFLTVMFLTGMGVEGGLAKLQRVGIGLVNGGEPASPKPPA